MDYLVVFKLLLAQKYLPEYDVKTQHSIQINADIGDVYKHIEDLDFSDSKLISTLFRLRGLPVPESMNLIGLQRIRFVLLEKKLNQGLILGIIGKFWTPSGHLQRFEAVEFVGIEYPGFAKAVWSFELEPTGETTLLRSETRVFCSSRREKRKFRWYWRFIGPFSSLIRKQILFGLKRKVEKNKIKPE